MSIAVARAGHLFDYSVEHPEGWLVPDACRHFKWSQSQLARAIRALRLILGTDEINLVCHQRGFGEPKLYTLVGDLERARPWAVVQLRGLESRLDSILAISRSLVNATDGRTTEGRKARLIVKHVTRLMEDFAELEGRWAV